MASLPALISILSLFLINHLKAQTGLGCAIKTCPIAGQVRINVVADYRGNFVSGCNCACDPSIFCPSPHVINFDKITGLGDCACHYRASWTPQVTLPTPVPTAYVPPTPVPTAQVIVPAPQASLPAPAPQTNAYVPVNPITVLCDTAEPCSCPVGHAGECRIICDGTTDACKGVLIECNNDGYPCFVECIAENACSGSTSIMGPVNAALSVSCVGAKSCEGDTEFNGEAGTDLSVTCNGATSCKNSRFNCGIGVSSIFCYGSPDACNDAVFILPPRAASIHGMAFSCVGALCPPDAPQAFRNDWNVVTEPPTKSPTSVETARCAEYGDCSCAPGAACKIICDGASDACKDGVIACNDGFHCVVDCISQESCSGSARITGPKGAAMTVNCIGHSSCQGATRIDGAAGTDLAINCAGDDACKGSAVVFDFPSGVNKVTCSGSPDSCVDAVFILPPRASSTMGSAFSCVGANCPALQQYNNAAPIPAPVGPLPIPAPVVILNPPTKQPTNPVAVARPSPYCCRTRILNFKPWRGYCWSETSAAGCSAVPSTRCVWKAADCLPDPPVNTFISMANTPCRFAEDACGSDSECCSETCSTDRRCR